MHAVLGLRDTGNIDLPTGARFHLHAAVVVPGPGTGDQNESCAAVAKLLLEHGARVGGDKIPGGRRIAVVKDACGAVLQQRLVEMIQGVGGIGQERLDAAPNASCRARRRFPALPSLSVWEIGRSSTVLMLRGSSD